MYDCSWFLICWFLSCFEILAQRRTACLEEVESLKQPGNTGRIMKDDSACPPCKATLHITGKQLFESVFFLEVHSLSRRAFLANSFDHVSLLRKFSSSRYARARRFSSPSGYPPDSMMVPGLKLEAKGSGKQKLSPYLILPWLVIAPRRHGAVHAHVRTASHAPFLT